MILASLILAASMASESPSVLPLVPFWDPPDAGLAQEVPVRLSMDGCQTDCEEIETMIRAYFPQTELRPIDTPFSMLGVVNETIIGFAHDRSPSGDYHENDYRELIDLMAFGSQLFVHRGDYGFLPFGIAEVEEDGSSCYLALWYWERFVQADRDRNAVLVFGDVSAADARDCLTETLTLMGRTYD